MNTISNKAVGANVILKGDRDNLLQLESANKEFISLAKVVKIEIVEIFTQLREKYSASLYIGKGKLEEIGNFMKDNEISTIIFSTPIKAGLKNNMERVLENILDKPVRLLDRNELILGIFALHARTSEAKIQVELAQLKYLLPRLLGKGTSLSNLGAGIGTRGPGETQLEIDRRKIQKRISALKKKLNGVSKRRELSRKRRKSKYLASLVGYTNSGKSTLINNITKGGAIVQNQVFATLSPVIRNLYLSSKKMILISDTVGFIRNLPTELLESFKSTMEEIKYSDILIFIVDISLYDWRDRLNVARKIVHKLVKKDKPALFVFNKMDILKDKDRTLIVKNELPDAIFISAQNGTGLSELKQKIEEIIYAHPEK